MIQLLIDEENIDIYINKEHLLTQIRKGKRVILTVLDEKEKPKLKDFENIK